MTPREVIPADISEEVEAEVSTALHKMVDDVRRYEAFNAESPWRPIATAPKDGSLFLAYMGKGAMEIARYDLERSEWWIDAYAPPQIEKCWMDAWMPLPEPPEGS